MPLYLGSGPRLKIGSGGVFYKVASSIKKSGLWYTMKKFKVFNGISDYIDTGIKLGEIDQNYTILVDISYIGDCGNQAAILNYMNEISPYPGLVVRVMSGSIIEGTLGKGGTLFKTGSLSLNMCRIAIIRDIIQNKYKAYWFDGVSINTTEKSGSFFASSQTLTIGASKNSNNIPFRYFKGTIDTFMLYNKVLDDITIQNFLKEGT